MAETNITPLELLIQEQERIEQAIYASTQLLKHLRVPGVKSAEKGHAITRLYESLHWLQQLHLELCSTIEREKAAVATEVKPAETPAA